MADKIRIGLVGANADGSSWGARAHVPAIKSLPDFKLKAICTAHAETATAAAKAFDAEIAYHDYNDMFTNPDIDLVSVAVRVPYHYEITMDALRAGKNVYCEWPLGANLREAEDMADLARQKGVYTMVGLQARSDPTVNYIRQLIGEGYVGEVVACHMTLTSQGALERTTSRSWMTDRNNGANVMTIQGGHHIDALCYCLGDFAEVSGKVATQVKQVRLSDTGGSVEATSPDNVLVSGVLENGAVASVYVGSVPFQGGGWRMEIYGTEGTLMASAAQANYAPQPIRLVGAKGSEPLAELSLPDGYVFVPEGTPSGAPYNVAQAYIRLGDAIRNGGEVDPDFAEAVKLHKLLAAMEQASDEGRSVRL